MTDRFTEHQVQYGMLLWRACSGGTPAQGHQMAWMNDVRVGDTVIEVTNWRAPWQDRIGILLREHDEPLFDDDGTTPLWRDEACTKQCTDHRWVIQTNDREMTWHNARFMRLPVTKHEGDLFLGWGARRCVVADCLSGCARETWTQRGGSWFQELRKFRL